MLLNQITGWKAAPPCDRSKCCQLCVSLQVGPWQQHPCPVTIKPLSNTSLLIALQSERDKKGLFVTRKSDCACSLLSGQTGSDS